jgi:hypothetical protein
MKYFILSLCFVEKVGCRVRMRALSVKEEMIKAMMDSTFKTIGDCLNCCMKSLSRAKVIQTYKDSL